MGIFITFEGIDGCGKTTQAKKVYDFLKNNGKKLLFTREPGGTTISEKIRNLLLDPQNFDMVEKTELLLYLAARAQHVAEKIVPAINDGYIVICDRFTDATIAYQGYGRELNIDLLYKMNDFAVNGLKPDRTYIFDIDYETAVCRLAKNGSPDRMEKNNKEFFEKVRHGYIEISRNEPQRIVLVNAINDIESIFSYIKQDLLKFLKL